MTISETLLQDFDTEMKGTRTTLERIPEANPDFKCHEKSMPMGRLAVHVATLPRFGITILTTDALDLATEKWPSMVFESREKLLADFDDLAAKARSALASATDEDLKKHWKMTWGDKPIAGVYLRLNDVPVPPLYGPSADDSMGF